MIIATGIIVAATGITTAAVRRPMTVVRRCAIVATGTMADRRQTTGRMTTIVVDGITVARRPVIMATVIAATGIATAEMWDQMTAIAGMTAMTTLALRLVADVVRP